MKRIRNRPLNVRTTLVAGTSVARGLFIEMFLTAYVYSVCPGHCEAC